MALQTLCITDTETTGVDRDKDEVLEVGYVLWSVEHRCIIEVFSGLLKAEANPAEHVNAIPAQLCAETRPVDHDNVWALLASALESSDAAVAHQADFDRAFCLRATGDYAEDVCMQVAAKPWICTREDMKWPRNGTGESLIATALAHGVAVTSAHRAIHDCLLIARLLEHCFTAYPDMGERLEAAFEHAKLPKVRLVSLAPFEEKEIVKANGFKWDQPRREWWRLMALEDAQALPFRVREVPL